MHEDENKAMRRYVRIKRLALYLVQERHLVTLVPSVMPLHETT